MKNVLDVHFFLLKRPFICPKFSQFSKCKPIFKMSKTYSIIYVVKLVNKIGVLQMKIKVFIKLKTSNGFKYLNYQSFVFSPFIVQNDMKFVSILYYTRWKFENIL